MDRRIVIMAGGTGGHVFPALAVAQELMARGWQVSWLGTRKGIESRVVPEHNIEVDWLSVGGLRGKGLKGKTAAVFKLVKAFVQAWRVLRRRRPDVVLGMGGFVAAPGGLVSWLQHIPLLIHEQNRVPGTTNRMLAKRADMILEAFPASFPSDSGAICTGNPLRQAFQDIPVRKIWHKEAGRVLHVLIAGGSQGAKVLNETVPEALARMTNIEIRHQTGPVMQQQVMQQYKALGLSARSEAFIDDMVQAYQWADLVICRAGAMTISELAAAGLPSVLIPLPHAIDDHQTANARYLSEAGAAILLPQNELNADSLGNAVNTIITNMTEMSRAASAQARLQATQAVADCCESEAGL